MTNPVELASVETIYRKLRKPRQIQDFLDDSIEYHSNVTCYSPLLVIRNRKAHCMEGAMFAAAALRRLGHEPLIVDLLAVRDDDHVLAVFRENGCWGAIAKSNYAGLGFRSPVYRTIRELAMSYFEHFYNLKGEKTLRGYSRPVNLSRFDGLNWMTCSDEIWDVPTYLCTIRHSLVLPVPTTRYWIDKRLYEAGRVGIKK